MKNYVMWVCGCCTLFRFHLILFTDNHLTERYYFGTKWSYLELLCFFWVSHCQVSLKLKTYTIFLWLVIFSKLFSDIYNNKLSICTLATALKCHNCWNGECTIKEKNDENPTQYCMKIKMDKGLLTGNFNTACNLPNNQCYVNDPVLSELGLKNDGCAEPTNGALKKLFKTFSDIGGSIHEICLCTGELCNGGPRVFLSVVVLTLSAIFLMTTMI